MKRFNKFLGVVLAVTVFASMAMASSSTDSDSTKAVSGDETTSSVAEAAASEDVTEKESETTAATAAALPKIEQQVLVDEKGIKITALEYSTDDIWGDGIKVEIENNTKKDLTVGCNALIVNDYMITDLMSASVAAGMKTKDTINLSSSQLKAAGINNIGQIEIYFHIYNSETYKTVLDTGCVTIKTDLYDKMDKVPQDNGYELYNDKGIRIVAKYADEDSFWGKAVVLYIENNTKKNVTIQLKNFSVNGYTVDPLFSSTVYKGKKAIDEITLLSSDLEEKDIDKIEEVQLAFNIMDAKSYKTITKTKALTFKVEQ